MHRQQTIHKTKDTVKLAKDIFLRPVDEILLLPAIILSCHVIPVCLVIHSIIVLEKHLKPPNIRRVLQEMKFNVW